MHVPDFYFLFQKNILTQISPVVYYFSTHVDGDIGRKFGQTGQRRGAGSESVSYALLVNTMYP